MALRTKKRLPAVQPLTATLPKGAEGGKEFARIVDLLLFHEARRTGKKITIFDDSAGDYLGMDSFEGDAFRRSGTTGYQYKFYPTSLSSDHRAEIKKSLQKTAEHQKELKLKKWILVLPEDLTQSSTRKDGGDVAWFESLRGELGVKFDLECWGHKNLISLFLETPALCLFYYPELVDRGANHRKTIQDTRQRYDDCLHELYGRIEFVGMSIYKDEATRGVPMEHIYIPLTAVPEAASSQDTEAERSDPVEFLRPGARHVVLGDPGSGKTTMMKFLSLIGTSPPLQKRCTAEADDRLPILITLRRYADELKTRRNLSIVDYMMEAVHGDYTLKAADLDYFEYYLESGRAILLFDGLDELPNPAFKTTVSERIRTLAKTYPGNTVVVTSRIVGYESPFRFDEKEFRHFRLAKLREPEIERFVHDWYAVRIENERQRRANAKSLIGIIVNPDSAAIRELAENPLLLAIMALVHRIQAELPDERVVLYQKCTETLLVSWHKWKTLDADEKPKGKEEHRNRLRIEAIAYWMHCRAGETGNQQRAVVPHDELHGFLTEYIRDIEKPEDPGDAVLLAEDFLDFVRKRAGLLIEAGDRQYSFVHLTFQEYLTATYIGTVGLKEGIDGFWGRIGQNCGDPRWQEVIRLFLAHLKALDCREILTDNILKEISKTHQPQIALLLGGILLDGIEAAEARRRATMRSPVGC